MWSVAAVGAFADVAGPNWEPEIQKMEARDKANPPAVGETVFAGSSSIRLWKLEESFPGLKAANEGFGGSTISECTKYAPRLVLPWKPKRVVFYAGDNDLKGRVSSQPGLSPEQVAEDCKAYAAVIHGALPECEVIFLPIKPSPSRWDLKPKQDVANRLIREWIEAQNKAVAETKKPARLRYVDTVPGLLGADGKPDPALFQPDMLHLKPVGYARWAALLKPILQP